MPPTGAKQNGKRQTVKSTPTDCIFQLRLIKYSNQSQFDFRGPLRHKQAHFQHTDRSIRTKYIQLLRHVAKTNNIQQQQKKQQQQQKPWYSS